MSDEESFVILGSSPISSLENDGMSAKEISFESLESDSPGSRFTSLKNSQISAQKNVQSFDENQIEPQMADPVMVKSTKIYESLSQMTESMIKTTQESDKDQAIAANNLWRKEVQIEENMLPPSLEDCALKSPLEEQHQQNANESIKQKSTSIIKEKSSIKTIPQLSTEKNLAASFIMGEVGPDVLKTSVYSQFPSISMQACAEDVLKLQNMVTEYSELKATIKKANNTMKLFYNNTMQWKEKMTTMEVQYKQQLENCQKEIEELRKQNIEMEDGFKKQIEALEIVCKNDREENIQALSEKNALLENMRAQIIKLEKQQLASYELVLQNQDEQQNVQFKKMFITHREHELKINDLQRELSKLLASNLDLKDAEKQYMDELNCLKVNLIAAEELIKKNRDEITELTASNIEKEQQMQKLQINLKTLELTFEEQKEYILLLETQNEVHRTDFEMEKQSRETAINEKQQMLQDLRSLQKRNKLLIEEHQKLVDNFQKKKLSAASASNEPQISAASAAAETYFNNPQRPIRVCYALPPTLRSDTSTPVGIHTCPVCNKAFKSLIILLSHVNDCVDKN